jgi:hypothetical protein
MIKRRNFLIGLIAAPVIVRASSLMKVRGIVMPWVGSTIYVDGGGYDGNDGRSPLYPLRTIQRALDMIAATGIGGDPVTIQVGAGDYDAPVITPTVMAILNGPGPSARIHGMLKAG